MMIGKSEILERAYTLVDTWERGHLPSVDVP